MSTVTQRAIQQALDDAIDAGLTPGAAAAVIDVDDDGDDIVVCAGTLNADDPDDARRLVTPQTVYDLASLTKLLVTTQLIADDVAAGVVRLDETPWSWWPPITVAHALHHTSGLPAHQKFHEQLLLRRRENGTAVGRSAGKDLVVDLVLRTKPEADIDERTLYSDLGFIALGALLEARHQRALDVLWSSSSHAQGHGARYVDLEVDGYHPLVPAVAPTERCDWRKRIVQGQVHDDNAFAMGGVAGHAGLFGSLDDVVVMARTMLRRLLDERDVLATFASTSGPRAERALGFDIATPGGSTGDVLGPRTVGHLGFTGTSLWLDPDARRAYVLLANTVHFGRGGIVARNKALRVAFHRAAVAR